MSNDNSKVTFKGSKLTLQGKALKVGDALPSFTLVAPDMSDLASSAFTGKTTVILTVPSLDTPTCSVETKRFNQEASKLGDKVRILVVSMDLPFAQKRWCGAEGVDKVVTGSDFKYRAAGEAFGAFIKEWGLLARAVFVVNPQGKITYVDYVEDISAEPQYEPVLKAISGSLEAK